MRNLHFALINENLEEFERLLKEDPTASVTDIIHFEGVGSLNLLAFAAYLGKSAFLEKLLEYGKDIHIGQLESDIEHDAAFIFASLAGHTHVLQWLIDKTPEEDKREKMIHAKNDVVFNTAIFKRNIPMLNFLFSHVSDRGKQQEMIFTNNPKIWNHDIFTWYTLGRSTTELNWLWSNSSEDRRKENIHSNFPKAISKAAKEGEVRMLEWFLVNTPEENLQELIHANNDKASIKAGRKGHIDILDLLLAYIPNANGRIQCVTACLTVIPPCHYTIVEHLNASSTLALAEQAHQLIKEKECNFTLVRKTQGVGKLYPTFNFTYICDILKTAISYAPLILTCKDIRTAFKAVKDDDSQITILQELGGYIVSACTSALISHSDKMLVFAQMRLTETPLETAESILHTSKWLGVKLLDGGAERMQALIDKYKRPDTQPESGEERLFQKFHYNKTKVIERS